LPKNFAHQFAPWEFGGSSVASGYGGTLLRLALRTPEQAAAGGISKVTALAGSLPSLLFLSLVLAEHKCYAVCSEA
jgi:hypothetical protein